MTRSLSGGVLFEYESLQALALGNLACEGGQSLLLFRALRLEAKSYQSFG
jgi:hypothetical protein